MLNITNEKIIKLKDIQNKYAELIFFGVGSYFINILNKTHYLLMQKLF